MSFILAWFLADFISGLVHWWEDRAQTGVSRFKFINGVRADNERHHQLPGYFLRLSWWENINTTAPITWTLAAVIWLSGGATFVWATFLYLGFGNLIHRWSHEPKGKRPKLVTLLQRAGVFVSPSHHAGHHFKGGRPLSRQDAYQRYCVMTNFLNPVLDGLKFWNFLEGLFS